MSQITWDQQAGYRHSNQVSDMLRESLRPRAKIRQFATLEDGENSGVGLNRGDTFYWNVYDTPARQNYRLEETQRIQSSKMTKQQRALTVTEMGRAIEHTEKANLLSSEDWSKIIESGLAFMASAQFDVETFLSFMETPLRASPVAGTSVDTLVFTENGVPSTTNDVALTTGHVKEIVDEMKVRNIPPHRDTDGNYFCISDPRNFRGIKNELEDIHQHTETGLAYIKHGEIGKYEDCIFIEQNMVPRGGAADSTLFDPHTNTADPWNNGKASWAIFFGDDAVTEAAVVPEEVRAKLPEDYGRDKGAAWYYLGGFASTHPDADNARAIIFDSAA